jgi:hypothetical protein
MDAFPNLTLGRSLYNFPTLTEEERQLIKAIIGERSRNEEAGLEVVRLLKRTFTIPSDITMMFDKSYNHYLALNGQIAFNVRKFLVSPFCLVL